MSDAVVTPATRDEAPARPFKEIVGISDEDIEAIYRVGCNMYEQGRYEDAEKFYGYLCICDAKSERFWLALGMARQMRDNYLHAYDAYIMAGSGDGNSPRPPLFAAECAMHFSQHDWAQSALLDAMELSGNDADPGSIKQRIAALQYGLNQRQGTAQPIEPAAS